MVMIRPLSKSIGIEDEWVQSWIMIRNMIIANLISHCIITFMTTPKPVIKILGSVVAVVATLLLSIVLLNAYSPDYVSSVLGPLIQWRPP